MDAATRDDFFTLLGWVGAATEGLGALLLDTGSPAAAVAAPIERLAALPAATRNALHAARSAWPRPPAHRRWGALSDSSLFVPISDARYPQPLREIPDPPPWLFCRGDLACLARPAVAIVGSRRASHGGLRAAGELAERLGRSGYTVCSGLALGIDAAAHRGALAGGKTVAVLASGLDRASPQQHRQLAQDVVDAGCLVSELPPGTPPSKYQFPRRNRIISGLASATIIVEAALPSGTLHTAAAALEQGRDVYTLPWSIYHAQGAGCLRLLRDGATPITHIDDLSTLFPGVCASSSKAERPLPHGQPGHILTLIGDSGLSVETLCRETGLAPGPMLIILAELEMGGWITRCDGHYRAAWEGVR